MSNKIGRIEAHQLISAHLPEKIAAAVINYWNCNWQGTEIYISSASKLTGTGQWRGGTLGAIHSAKGHTEHFNKILAILGGHRVRF